MRTIGLMAAMAIVFLVYTSPEDSVVQADRPPCDVQASQWTMPSKLEQVQAAAEIAAVEPVEVESESAEIVEPVEKLVHQVEDCPDGTCPLPSKSTPAVVTAPPVVSSPVVFGGSSGGTMYAPVVVSQGYAPVSYGCTGSTVSYGSTGTSYQSASGVCRQPVRRIIGGTINRVAQPVRRVANAAVQVADVAYRPRWNNFDGLTKRQHAQAYHGISTSGMSDTQIAMALDADHDAYGGGHPAAMRSRSVTYSTATSNCPGGVCPTGTSSTFTRTRSSKGGLLGFGILGRRR